MKKLAKCAFCDKLTKNPIHVTEVNNDGTVSGYDMCPNCSQKMSGGAEPEEKTQLIDVSHITTPEQLLDFLTSFRSKGGSVCDCGLTSAEFEENGKFGCAKCYTHFEKEMAKLVFPYHGADRHVGKSPKALKARRLEESPAEKVKWLRLQLARALELEQYERASEIKKEIQQVASCLQPPSTSSDQ